MNIPASASRLGLIQALLAALAWGVMPIYFKFLQSVPALEIVAHRVIWSVPLLFIIIWLRRSLPNLKAAIFDHRNRSFLIFSALFVAANWLIYVWAVQNDHILAASLGYFISPLLNVVLGTIFFKERLSRNQWIAVAIATIGVAVLAVSAWQTLWISLALAGSWALYGVIRKMTTVGPMVGLTFETGLLMPIALAYVFWLVASGQGTGFGQSLTIELLLVGAAIMTAIPLLLFASAVTKISLTSIGLLQYLAPTIQFFIGVFLYREPVTAAHIICFGLIWISLAIYSADAYFGGNMKKPAATSA